MSGGVAGRLPCVGIHLVLSFMLRACRARAVGTALEKKLGWRLSEAVRIERMDLGLSNANFKVICADQGPVFLREYGNVEGAFNPHEQHIRDSGIGAELLEHFEWGHLEAWIPGRPMRRQDCNDAGTLAQVAAALRRLHDVSQRNHNDLNFTNIHLHRPADGSPIQAHFVDFEYAGELDVPLELANFFSEWMYDHTQPTQWFEPDMTLFPSKEQAWLFVGEYLGPAASESEISHLLQEVERRVPEVHQRWIDWTHTHFPHDEIYLKYAERRRAMLAEGVPMVTNEAIVVTQGSGLAFD